MTDFDLQAIVDALPYLILSGLRFTLLLTFTSTVGGLLLGTLLAIARLYGGRLLAWPATVYVNLFRSLPLVLVIFLIYFILPYALQAVTGAERPIVLGAMGSAFITFILFEAAYFSEIGAGGASMAKSSPTSVACAWPMGRCWAMTTWSWRPAPPTATSAGTTGRGMPPA